MVTLALSKGTITMRKVIRNSKHCLEIKKKQNDCTLRQEGQLPREQWFWTYAMLSILIKGLWPEKKQLLESMLEHVC